MRVMAVIVGFNCGFISCGLRSSARVGVATRSVLDLKNLRQSTLASVSSICTISGGHLKWLCVAGAESDGGPVL